MKNFYGKLTHQDKIESIINDSVNMVHQGYLTLDIGETIESYKDSLRKDLSTCNAAEVNQLFKNLC